MTDQTPVIPETHANANVININGKEYALDQLSEDARMQITNVRVTDQEIARLKQQLAIVQTARSAYANALMAALPKE